MLTDRAIISCVGYCAKLLFLYYTESEEVLFIYLVTLGRASTRNIKQLKIFAWDDYVYLRADLYDIT